MSWCVARTLSAWYQHMVYSVVHTTVGDALPRLTLLLHCIISVSRTTENPLARSLTHIPSLLPPFLCTHPFPSDSHSWNIAFKVPSIAVHCSAVQCSAVQEHYEYRDQEWGIYSNKHTHIVNTWSKGHQLLDFGVNYRGVINGNEMPHR